MRRMWLGLEIVVAGLPPLPTLLLHFYQTLPLKVLQVLLTKLEFEKETEIH